MELPWAKKSVFCIRNTTLSFCIMEETAETDYSRGATQQRNRFTSALDLLLAEESCDKYPFHLRNPGKCWIVVAQNLNATKVSLSTRGKVLIL